MIGITPDAFTLSGMYCLTPPYCLFPTTRFAYCTGILLVPCTNNIDTTITNSNNATSINTTRTPANSKNYSYNLRLGLLIVYTKSKASAKM